MARPAAPDAIERAFRDLNGALFRSDGVAAIAAAEEIEALGEKDLPQHLGEAARLGLAQGVAGAAGMAERTVAALRERQAAGDEDLALELDAALGLADPPELRALPIDLGELSTALEGDPMLTGGKIDLRTGEVHHVSPLFEEDDFVDDGEADAELADDPTVWLWFDSLGSRDGFDDMVRFLATVQDEAWAAQLERALDTRHPFRRFKDVLSGSPREIARFQRFADDRQLGRAGVARVGGSALRGQDRADVDPLSRPGHCR